MDPFAALTEDERTLLREAPRPTWLEPMKAVLTDERFSRDGWIFERKLDGIRCLAFKADEVVRLRSRNDLSLNGRFGEVADALAADPVRDVVLDGEVVAFQGSQTSFARLQARGERPARVFFYVFDLLYLAGHDTTALPLVARKRLLRRLARRLHRCANRNPNRNRSPNRSRNPNPNPNPNRCRNPSRCVTRRPSRRVRALVARRPAGHREGHQPAPHHLLAGDAHERGAAAASSGLGPRLAARAG